jgi:hypothetical protein
MFRQKHIEVAWERLREQGWISSTQSSFLI